MDPDPGEKKLKEKTEKCMDIGSNFLFYFKNLSKFGPASWLITFELSILSFLTPENSS